jgi:ABC-type antimicrobial peptide transport system permease subunit
MLISVYERYQEIGTMKCLGALDLHILTLILVESGIQGIIGGILGFFLGLTASLISINFTTKLDIIFKIPTTQILLYFIGTILLSTILSIGASFYPAWRASRLKPVEALKHEL